MLLDWLPLLFIIAVFFFVWYRRSRASEARARWRRDHSHDRSDNAALSAPDNYSSDSSSMFDGGASGGGGGGDSWDSGTDSGDSGGGDSGGGDSSD